MKSVHYVFVWSLGLLVQCAQDGEEGERFNAKCDLSSNASGIIQKYCAEYPSLSSTQTEEIKKICILDHGGLWSSDATCSSSDVKGKCNLSNGSISFSYYYYSGFTPDTAKQNCELLPGSFQTT